MPRPALSTTSTDQQQGRNIPDPRRVTLIDNKALFSFGNSITNIYLLFSSKIYLYSNCSMSSYVRAVCRVIIQDYWMDVWYSKGLSVFVCPPSNRATAWHPQCLLSCWPSCCTCPLYRDCIEIHLMKAIAAIHQISTVCASEWTWLCWCSWSSWHASAFAKCLPHVATCVACYLQNGITDGDGGTFTL